MRGSMAARWIRDIISLPSPKSRNRPSILNTVPDQNKNDEYEMISPKRGYSLQYNRQSTHVDSFANDEPPDYIRMLQSSNGRGGNVSRARSNSYVVQQRKDEVPAHLRTDQYVKSEVPAHLRTDNYSIGRSPSGAGRSEFRDSFVAEDKLRRKRKKQDAIERAKNRDAVRKLQELQKGRKKKVSLQLFTRKTKADGASTGTAKAKKRSWLTSDKTSNESAGSAGSAPRNTWASSRASSRAAPTSGSQTYGIDSRLPTPPFSAVAVSTHAATGEREVSVEAGSEVTVLDVSQSSSWWMIRTSDSKEVGWIPKFILVFDGMPSPRDEGLHDVGRSGFIGLSRGPGPPDPRRKQKLPPKWAQESSKSGEGSAGTSPVPQNRPDLSLSDNPIFYAKVSTAREDQTAVEMKVERGEVVVVTDCMQSNDWWYCHRQFNPEQTGWVPKHLLRRVTDEERLRSDDRQAATNRRQQATRQSAFSFDTSDIVSSRKKTGRPCRARSKYAVEAIATPMHSKRTVAETGKQLLQDLDTTRVLRRFLSGGGSEWVEMINEEGKVMYHNTEDKLITEIRPGSAKVIRRMSSHGKSAWEELQDQNGDVFYYNTSSGEKRSTPPGIVKELETIQSGNGSIWQEVLDAESGASYWYNKDKDESSWSRPARANRGRGSSPECIICMDREACVALIPCWHATYCSECAEKLNECPQCKQKVEDRQKFFL